MRGSVDRRAQELEERGERFALATVVRVDRPVSARPGDRAVIRSDGRLEGWVGGSCSQPIVTREALATLSDGRPRLVRIRPPGARPEPVEPGVVTEVTACASEGGLDIFVEPRVPRPVVVIAGSSPAARSLAQLAAVLGRRVHAALADPAEQVPGVDTRLALEELGAAALNADDAVVVATMNRYDEAALEAALSTGAGYVGLIASRPRAAKVLHNLRARGVDQADLDRVHSPAGLDLGPSSQEEIALAVLGEIVALQRHTAEAEHPLCAPSEAIDPVCGMTVSATPVSPSAIHENRMVFFCSPHCKSAFESEPARYESTGS
jgi:xanthine dehydrogenase accessory factor